MKKLFLAVSVAVLCLGSALALLPPDTESRSDSVWLRIYAKGDVNNQTYIEAAKGGSVLVRMQSSGKITTRHGTIKKQLVKDLFQEMKSNDVFEGSVLNTGRMLFYKGDVLQINALWQGEIRTTEIPLEKLTPGFKYALNAMRDEAVKQPADKTIYRFVQATPIESDVLASDEDDMGRESHRYKYLETSLLEKSPAVSKAILRPRMLVPLNSKKESEELFDFLYGNKVRGESGDFRVSTSRGDFKIEILKASY